MYHVDLYIETSIKGPGTRTGWCASCVGVPDEETRSADERRFSASGEGNLFSVRTDSDGKILEKTKCELLCYHPHGQLFYHEYGGKEDTGRMEGEWMEEFTR